jgi:hypothetical protein
MLTDACTKAVVGLSALVDAIVSLETELKATQQLVKTLEERINGLEAADGIDVELIDRILENYDLAAKVEAVLETHTFDGMLEDKVREAIDAYDFCEDIDNALSGREVTVTL